MLEGDLLSQLRTIEIPQSTDGGDPKLVAVKDTTRRQDIPKFYHPWRPFGPDIFGDGSVFVVDTPSHLPGHINLLVRTGKDKYIY